MIINSVTAKVPMRLQGGSPLYALSRTRVDRHPTATDHTSDGIGFVRGPGSCTEYQSIAWISARKRATMIALARVFPRDSYADPVDAVVVAALGNLIIKSPVSRRGFKPSCRCEYVPSRRAAGFASILSRFCRNQIDDPTL